MARSVGAIRYQHPNLDCEHKIAGMARLVSRARTRNGHGTAVGKKAKKAGTVIPPLRPPPEPFRAELRLERSRRKRAGTTPRGTARGGGGGSLLEPHPPFTGLASSKESARHARGDRQALAEPRAREKSSRALLYSTPTDEIAVREKR